MNVPSGGSVKAYQFLFSLYRVGRKALYTHQDIVPGQLLLAGVKISLEYTGLFFIRTESLRPPYEP